ncbi:T9SS type A sorting domain-containing protein [Algibacter sp. TI.3.09]|uniref:T9SS type A sorting domain-containing protein n=1 Tax=Algibacter sp. TI.3.09 TaxID=3121298 RepID=UPI00311E5DE2
MKNINKILTCLIIMGLVVTSCSDLEDYNVNDRNTTLYNFNNSYCTVQVSLYNKTDDIELATNTSGLQGVGHVSGADIDAVTLSYTAVAADNGDVLEVRYVKTQAGASRNYAIDILELNGAAVGPTVVVVSAAGTWSSIGDTALSNTTDDTDNGDGENDGAIYVDGQSAVVGQGAAFTFNDVMLEGTPYEVKTTIYNPDASFCGVTVFLYNVTDGLQLTIPTDSNLSGGNIGALTINYTAMVSDAGDVLELRYVRDDDGNVVRNFSIDNASINGAVISTDVSSLSIENNLLNTGISIYPNPTNGVINISKTNTNINIKKVILFDVTGKTIYSQFNNQTINVSNFLKGLYILKIEFQDGGVATRKVVVK